jgi:hypothetical protein
MASGYEIGFYVLLGLVVAVIGVVLASVVKDKVGDVAKPFSAYITTWFSLFPYVFVLAGPIIDVITNQYMYTKASIVGILTVALVGLVFGSNWYASMSKTLVGWLPSIKDTYGAWNYTGIAVWAMVFLFGFGAPAISFIRGTTTGSLVTGLIGGVLLTILLAGQDWLGGTSFTRTGWYPSTSFAGVTISDVCTTPGLGCVQTSFAPAGILLSSSILASHLFESIDTGNSGQTTALGATLATSFVIEFLTLYSKGCRIEYKYGLFSPFISLALGIGSGAAAYYSMKRLGQGTESFGEGGIFHPPVAPTSKTHTGKKDSSVPTSGEAEQCSSGVMDEYEDGDIALVGELFKDGVPITSDVTVA